MEDAPLVGEPEDSHEAIMQATHRAIREYGYAGLSIQRIADEADLSKSTFYHHFDSKDDLLASFIEYILAAFVRVFTLESCADPEQNLHTFIELLACPMEQIEFASTDEIDDILNTYVEVRAQAVRSDDVRAQFTAADEAFTNHLAEIIESGIEDGVFQDVEPYQTARFISTVLGGNTFARSTRNGHEIDAVLAELNAYIETRLLR
jgi:AcrR family transcriptional regulator